MIPRSKFTLRSWEPPWRSKFTPHREVHDHENEHHSPAAGQSRRNLGEWGWSCFLSWSNKSDILKEDYDKELEQLEWSKCMSKCTKS